MKTIRILLATTFLALATCATVPIRARIYYGSASVGYDTDSGVAVSANLRRIGQGFAK